MYNTWNISVVAASALLLTDVASAAQDTLVLQSRTRAAWGDPVQFEETLRLGALDGPEWTTYGSIVGVVAADNGNAFVADQQVPIIRLYSQEGEYVRDVGRAGEGPGEYRRLQSIKPHPPSGGIAIWDPRNVRITVFDSVGEFVKSIRVDITEGFYAADPFQVDTAGNYYLKMRTSPQALPEGGWPLAWLKLAPDGGKLDTVPIPPPAYEGPSFSVGGVRPFPFATVAVISPHGHMVSGRNEEYAWRRPLADGRILKVVRSYTPAQVKADEHAQWEAWRTYFNSRGGSYTSVPREKPAYRDLWVDSDGRIWVWRYAEARYQPTTRAVPEERPVFEWREPRVFDIYTPQGTFCGTLTPPDDGWVAFARGRQVWTVEAGDSDEQYVVRYRIIDTSK